jgi:Flp pilus assembly protein TadG
VVQLTRRGLLLRARREEKGAVTVVVALMMIVLVMCAALVIDLGNAKDQRRQSQNASDAAALAAVNVLYPTAPATTCPSGAAPPCFTEAVAAVKSFAAKNYDVTAAQWSTCSITATQALPYVPTAGQPCISFDSQTAPKKVRVWMPTKTVSTFFGGVTGNSTIPVGSQADAIVESRVKCTLCFLGSVNAQNADFDVTGGAIAVNGNVDAGPNSNWTSLTNGVVGTVTGGVFNPAPTPIQPFSDPLAGKLTLPIDISTLPLRTNPCTDGPGRYTSISLGNNVTCNLTPGFYAVTGEWLIGNNTQVLGTGVTLYAQAPNGYLNFKNGNVTISAPSSGTYKDYAIIYDPSNTNPISLQGNGNTGITGIVYAPSSPLDFNGNSCFGFDTGPIVVSGVQLANGNQSCVRITNPADTTVTRTPLHLTN